MSSLTVSAGRTFPPLSSPFATPRPLRSGAGAAAFGAGVGAVFGARARAAALAFSVAAFPASAYCAKR